MWKLLTGLVIVYIGFLCQAQTTSGDLNSIAHISGGRGLLKKVTANNWQLDLNDYVTASITNGLASTNYVNTTVQTATNGLSGGGVTLTGVTNVVSAYTNNLATTNYVNTATNNLGKSVAVNMTNSANQFTGNFTGTFGALVSSSSVTVNTNTIYTYGPGLGSGFFFIENNTDYPYTNAFNNSYVCKYGSAYYITNVSGMYKSYYSGTIIATNSSGYSSTNWVNSSGGTINFIPNGGSIYPAGTYFPSTTNITTVGNGSGITNIPTSGVSNFLGAVTNVASALTNGLATTNYVNTATNGFITLVNATNVAGSLTNGFITLNNATNVAAALTNQLVIPTTNQFVSTNNTTWFDTNGAGVAAALIATNGIASGATLSGVTNVVNALAAPIEAVTEFTGNSTNTVSQNFVVFLNSVTNKYTNTLPDAVNAKGDYTFVNITSTNGLGGWVLITTNSESINFTNYYTLSHNQSAILFPLVIAGVTTNWVVKGAR